MIENLSVYTLGGLSIHLDGKPVSSLHSRKAQALLVYLAVTARPQPREVLADLFWEEFSQKRAMNNLRVVLSNLRKHLGDHLLITRDTAVMNPGMDFELDVAVLDANLEIVGEYERKAGMLNRESVERIEQAVDLYKGEFLEGFFVENALDFDAWMVLERERLHHILVDGLGKLVRWELAQGENTTGIRHASKWLQLDSLSEIAHRQMMRLLFYSGQRSAALGQYEHCKEILAEELGVEPDTKTTALYKQIRMGVIPQDETIPQHIPPADTGKLNIRRHNLPVQTTLFIGREQELTDLNQLLTDPEVRLVTVLGAGGMGKTRLVLEAAKSILDQFSDGVFFVSLARLQSAELIVPSIIRALGIEFAREGAEARESIRKLKDVLLNHLRRKQMLLILDNYEHLLDGVNLVSEIIQTTPYVKVLATSRFRLNIGGEHRFQVVGMAYPEDIQDEKAQNFSAVRLFLESARRSWSSFDPHPDEMKHITNICRLMDGMPLGIRLAAAWVETLSPKEIAAEIAQNLDLLEIDLWDMPKRHLSIRSLFDHSWSLLSERERDVFQKISVFRGGCNREAAQEITGATLRDLRCLVEKSLLHRILNGRYEIHELSREYGAEKLQRNPQASENAYRKHSVYYSIAVGIWGNDLKSTRQETALTEMDAEIENARVAWNWAVEQRQADLLDKCLEGFRHYFAIRRLIQEAETVFRQAAKRFKSGYSCDELRVYARLLSMQGYFTYGYERERKQNLYQQSLKILDNLEGMGQDVRHEKACVQNFMGEIALTTDFDESLRLYKQSLNLFKESSDHYWASDTLIGLGKTYFLWGNMGEAYKCYQQSLANFRELGDSRKIAQILGLFDWFFKRQGKYKEAEYVSRERLEIYKMIDDQSAIADGQAELASCYGLLGEPNKAETLLEKAMEVHKVMEHFTEFFEDARFFCLNYLDLGKYEQAFDLAQYALDWSAGRFSTSSERVKGETRLRRIGLTLSNQGMAMLALGKLAEAELLLGRSHIALKDVFPATNPLLHHALLGIVSLKLNRPDQAKEHIQNGLRKGLEIRSSVVQQNALSAAALFLADQGDCERAVEIYALASRYPWISKSQWYQDVIEGPLTTLTASLSSEVIAAAQKRGRERDLEATVQELLIELA